MTLNIHGEQLELVRKGTDTEGDDYTLYKSVAAGHFLAQYEDGVLHDLGTEEL